MSDVGLILDRRCAQIGSSTTTCKLIYMNARVSVASPYNPVLSLGPYVGYLQRSIYLGDSSMYTHNPVE